MNTVPVSSSLAERERRVGVARPDRRGQAVAAVVHARDRLVVVRDRHDARRRGRSSPRSSRACRGRRRRAPAARGTACPARSRGNARASISARAPFATASAICARTRSARARARQRAERGRRVERVAEHGTPAPCATNASTKRVVERALHVDALDAAARLARVEEGAVDEVLDRVRRGRRRRARRRGPCRRARGPAEEALAPPRAATAWPPSTEPVNATKSIAGVAIMRAIVVVVAVHELEHAAREARRRERLAEALGARAASAPSASGSRRCPRAARARSRSPR